MFTQTPNNIDEKMKLLEILTQSKLDYFDPHSPEFQVLTRLMDDLGFGTKKPKRPDLTNMNWQTGMEEDFSHDWWMENYAVRDLEMYLDQSEQKTKDLVNQLAIEEQYQTKLRGIIQNMHDSIGLAEHVKENYQDAVFDYNIRKGND